MPSFTKILLATCFGMLAGASIIYFNLFNISNLPGNTQGQRITQQSDEPELLYWVAPMDDNYRRDKPGKSPMGMDLVPVYQQVASSNAQDDTRVRISPQVINNLGVKTAPVEQKIMHTAIKTVGYVQHDEDKLVHIHPRVEGWIDTLFVKAAGEPVKKGQALYRLYSPQLVNAQEEYLIALKRNNQALIRAAKARLSALHLSDDFIESLTKSKVSQQTITFYAPQNGVVDGLKIREGFFVKPGTTLMSIAQLEQVWVEVEVFERDSAQVKQGLAVTMSLDYQPNKEWFGVVDYIYPTLDEQTRTLRIRLKFKNEDLMLKPNMFAQVNIDLSDNQPTIVVPKEAVIRTGTQDRVVLALGGGEFKSVAINIGRVSDNNIEILTGVMPGDVVVTSAQFLIDSESSKNSDFKRMSDNENKSEKENSATVNGVIKAINIDTRVLTIDREAITKWQRPPATMDFVLADHIDISMLKTNMKVRFTFEVDEDFVIVSLRPVMIEMADASHDHLTH